VPSESHVPGSGAFRIPAVDGGKRHPCAVGEVLRREVSVIIRRRMRSLLLCRGSSRRCALHVDIATGAWQRPLGI
jgi:hypothetical protein